jgi:glycosyltransferase involved in cell wall biosynthesis
MKISIILATFNGEKYLREQLESISKQTKPPHELIIGDDASEDRTLAVAQEFARTAPFTTKVIRNPERFGYMQNFSCLATQSSGDVLAFCDQDDIWAVDKLEVIERYFSRNPRVMCVIHDITVTDAERNFRIPSLLSHLHHSNYSTNVFIKGCATAARKELTNVTFPLPKNSAWAHDNIVHAVAMIIGARHVMHEILIDHRIHSRNTSGLIAPKATVRRRFNTLIDNFEMSKVPRNIYPMAIPRECSEQDLNFLFDAASRIAGASAQQLSEIYGCIRALDDLAKTRIKAKDLSIWRSFRLINDKRRVGTYRKIGGVKIIIFEYFRILIGTAFRVQKSMFRSTSTHIS